MNRSLKEAIARFLPRVLLKLSINATTGAVDGPQPSLLIHWSTATK